MPRKAISRRAPPKLRQQSLLSHFSSSPPAATKSTKSSRKHVYQSDSDSESEPQVIESSVRPPVRRSRPTAKVEEDSDSSDVGKIKFEARSNSSDADELTGPEAGPSSPNRPAKRRRVLGSDSDESQDKSPQQSKRASRCLTKRKEEPQEDETHSESDVPQKRKGRLVKGRKPSSEEDPDDAMDGIDENKIIDSRLRGQPSKKSRFMQNLERLKKKRGMTIDDEEEEEEEETNEEVDGLIPGARLSKQEGGESSESGEDQSDEAEIDDFIVDDEGDAQTAALPAIFSMNTHQDLIHHFKIVCQYLVHLAVTTPSARERMAERLTADEYFSVPLIITRRKLADLRDSIVSSVWRPDYKKALRTYPDFNLIDLDFAIPHCDACNLGGRMSKLVGRCSGEPYDQKTFLTTDQGFSSDDSDNERERTAPEFNLGRFCAQRTSIFHELCHWELELFRELSREVDELSSNGRGFVRVAYSGGTQPPEDVSDADAVMEWLDQRGIINAEWMKVKLLMTRATNLEADVKRGKEDD